MRVPNIVTPNWDGLNDLFTAHVRGEISSFDLSIRNALGQVVFQSDSLIRHWNAIDHTENDSMPTSGVYYYHLDVTSISGGHVSTNHSFFVAPDTALDCISPSVAPVFYDSFKFADCDGPAWPTGDHICIY